MKYFVSNQLYDTLSQQCQFYPKSKQWGNPNMCILDKLDSTIYKSTQTLLSCSQNNPVLYTVIKQTNILDTIYIPDIYACSRFLEIDMKYRADRYLYITWKSWQFSRKALHYIVINYPDLLEIELYDDEYIYASHGNRIDLPMRYIQYYIKRCQPDKINWSIISRSSELDNDFIIKYKSYIDWYSIQPKLYRKFTYDLLRACHEHLDWNMVSDLSPIEEISKQTMDEDPPFLINWNKYDSRLKTMENNI